MATETKTASRRTKRAESKKTKTVLDQLKERQKQSSPKKFEEEKPKLFIPSGSTLLNLACTDNIQGAFIPGKMSNIIGDSSSGKSFLALSVCAEMAYNSEFDDYRLLYDDTENANQFDMEYLFGKATADRLETIHSDTVQDFQFNINDALKGKHPFIYILDSLDALTSEEDLEKFEERRIAREKGKDTKGTYGVQKPKTMSETLRQIVGGMDNTKSHLIVISQVRENLNPFSFDKKYRAGGRALKFYCTHEIWLAVSETINSKGRAIGIQVKVKVTKNKVTGKPRTIGFPIFYDYGIDDIRSCVDFLSEEGTWEKKGAKITPTGLPHIGNDLLLRHELIRKIEEFQLEDQVKNTTGETWKLIEESLKLNRKAKYD